MASTLGYTGSVFSTERPDGRSDRIYIQCGWWMRSLGGNGNVHAARHRLLDSVGDMRAAVYVTSLAIFAYVEKPKKG